MVFEGCGRRRKYISSCRARHSQRGERCDADGGQKDTRKGTEYNKQKGKGQKHRGVERKKNSADRRKERKSLIKREEELRTGLKGKLQRKGCCMAGTATSGREYTGPVKRVILRGVFPRLFRDWSQRRASALPQGLSAAR